MALYKTVCYEQIIPSEMLVLSHLGVIYCKQSVTCKFHNMTSKAFFFLRWGRALPFSTYLWF